MTPVVSPRLHIMIVGGIALMAAIRFRPAIKPFLTKATEVQHREQGAIPDSPKQASGILAPIIHIWTIPNEIPTEPVYKETTVMAIRIAITQAMIIPCPRSANPKDLNPLRKSSEDTSATHAPNSHGKRSSSPRKKVSILASQEATVATNT